MMSGALIRRPSEDVKIAEITAAVSTTKEAIKTSLTKLNEVRRSWNQEWNTVDAALQQLPAAMRQQIYHSNDPANEVERLNNSEIPVFKQIIISAGGIDDLTPDTDDMPSPHERERELSILHRVLLERNNEAEEMFKYFENVVVTMVIEQEDPAGMKAELSSQILPGVAERLGRLQKCLEAVKIQWKKTVHEMLTHFERYGVTYETMMLLMQYLIAVRSDVCEMRNEEAKAVMEGLLNIQTQITVVAVHAGCFPDDAGEIELVDGLRVLEV